MHENYIFQEDEHHMCIKDYVKEKVISPDICAMLLKYYPDKM